MGKKIKVVKQSRNKRLIADCMGMNHKNLYYQKKKEEKDLIVRDRILKTFTSHPAYGHRRLALELKMNKKKILRIMHKFNLKPPRLWYQKKYLTKSDPLIDQKYNNLLKDLDIRKYIPGQLLSSDLTYLKFAGRFLYLVVIKDIVSKEIVAFNVSDRHDSDLILKTLKEAVLKAKMIPLIFHSDRGREYLSQNCITFLENLKIKISVADPGSPWQNGWSESFFSTLKTESGDLNRFEDIGELIEYLYGYINYYNNERIINSLKMSPVQYLKSLRICS